MTKQTKEKPETVAFQQTARLLARSASVSLPDARQVLTEHPDLLEKIASIQAECDANIQKMLASVKP